MTLLSFQKVKLEIPSQKNPILDEIALDVSLGDFIVLLGSNGSGKSSLLKMINGLAIPSRGQILFQERSLISRPIHKRSRSIVTLTQDLNLSTFSNLTVLENCILAIHRKKRIFFSSFKRSLKEKIFSHLEQFHSVLCDKCNEMAGSLSGGERQILGLAMSLFTIPDLLLLDEHTSALDPDMAHKVMEITHRVVTSNNITTIMTTHNLNDALAFGNRVIALHRGKMILDTTQKQTLTKNQLLALYNYKR